MARQPLTDPTAAAGRPHGRSASAFPAAATSAGLVLLLLVTLAAGCGDRAPEAEAEAPGARRATVDGAVDGTYERNIVFASVDGDSILIVPWLLTSVQGPDSVRRYHAGWLARGRIWDAFYEDRWSTPPTRAPQRVLPHGSLGLVVRDGDAIDGILYEEGPRSLEVVIGDVSANWVGSRGETVEVMEGAAYLSDQRIEGAVLDFARASPEGASPGGDWAFLLSGDSARFVLMAEAEHGGDTEPTYRGWADLDDEAEQWPEVRVQWRRTQAFPPARRDVPVEWRFEAADGSVAGDLTAVSSEITAGDGPGPLLPVRALFEVRGQVATDQGRFAVHGLVVHERR